MRSFGRKLRCASFAPHSSNVMRNKGARTLFKNFLKGLVFGAGFFIAVITCFYTYIYFVSDTTASITNPLSNINWHESSVENRIKTSSVILLVKFVKNSNGELVPVVDEFLKKDEDVTFYYQKGDIYLPLNKTFYEHAHEGKKVLLLFVGANAQNMSSMSVFNDTVGGLGNIPISTIRQMVSNGA